MKKYLLASVVSSFTMAGVLVSETAFGALQVVCPPHDGGFNEPAILDTETDKITRIHNKTVRAVAQLVCDGYVCGNGVPEPGEQCDPGAETVNCDADCTNAFCGDMFVNVTRGEQCDDGNVTDGDGCSANCTTEGGPPVCGNNILEEFEDCDDGNASDNDDCTNTCQHPTCGDGITWNEQSGSEECDAGGESGTCDADCTLSACGDGTVNVSANEQCDDGNVIDGDGCSASCTIEVAPVCGNNIVEPPEECDAGGESGTCDADCTLSACGDGTVNVSANEQCDDGNNFNTDNCTNACTNAFCGDSFVWSGVEQCDSGGIFTATCDTDCTVPQCGDGLTNSAAGEQCDDGNTDPNDGCDSCMLTGPCGGEPLVTHFNGLGQTWEDCVPLGTYNGTQAVAACDAWGIASCVVSQCGEATNPVDIVCANQGTAEGSCACWGYAGPGAGLVTLATNGAQCVCPLPTTDHFEWQ